MKEFQQEAGADFLLRGDINTIAGQDGGERVKYYNVNLALVNMETNRNGWVGQKNIKKLASQSGAKF